MPYITKQTPTPRSEDTVLGKLAGFTQEMLFYINLETECGQIDALIPDWFPLNYIQDGLIAIKRFLYEINYQKVYEQGADQGNKMNNEVFGWVTQAKGELTRYADKAKSELQTIINDVKARVGSLDSLISDTRAKINVLNTSVVDLNSKMGEARRYIDRFNIDIKDLYDRIKKLEEELGKRPSGEGRSIWDILFGG